MLRNLISWLLFLGMPFIIAYGIKGTVEEDFILLNRVYVLSIIGLVFAFMFCWSKKKENIFSLSFIEIYAGLVLMSACVLYQNIIDLVLLALVYLFVIICIIKTTKVINIVRLNSERK